MSLLLLLKPHGSGVAVPGLWTIHTSDGVVFAVASPDALAFTAASADSLAFTAAAKVLVTSGTPVFNGNSTCTIDSSSDRVLAPASLLDETQCWIAMRIQPSWASTDSPLGGSTNPRLFRWGTTIPDALAGGYQVSSDKWFVQRFATGGAASEFTVEGTAESFSAGDSRTVIFAFEPTRIRVSGQGRAFTSTAAAPDIPSLATDTFEIGSDQINNSHLSGSILWVAAGLGALTDANATTLHGFGDTDPSFDQLPGSPTFLWTCDSTTWQDGVAASFTAASADSLSFTSHSPEQH